MIPAREKMDRDRLFVLAAPGAASLLQRNSLMVEFTRPRSNSFRVRSVLKTIPAPFHTVGNVFLITLRVFSTL